MDGECSAGSSSKTSLTPKTRKILMRAGDVVGRESVDLIDGKGIDRLVVRSPMNCLARRGVCQMCYGNDLARNQLVNLGTAVGIIAAQSIGEPATQLTMRTFHTGGTYQAEDITRGLPRVEELFEARVPKGQAVVSDIDGTVEFLREDEAMRLRVSTTETIEEVVALAKGFKASVKKDAVVREGAVIATGPDPAASKGNDAQLKIKAPIAGSVTIKGRKITISRDEIDSAEYPIAVTARVLVSEGDAVKRGQRLTEGPLNPHDLLRTRGEIEIQRYLLSEIQSVLPDRWRPRSRQTHRDRDPSDAAKGNSSTSPAAPIFCPANSSIACDSTVSTRRPSRTRRSPPKATLVMLGVTKASLNTESFLAAASFQDTTRVLTEAALMGSSDRLRGLKENVIIGKLIPAGTGFGIPEFGMIADGDGAKKGPAAGIFDTEAGASEIGEFGAEAASDGESASDGSAKDGNGELSEGEPVDVDGGKESS